VSYESSIANRGMPQNAAMCRDGHKVTDNSIMPNDAPHTKKKVSHLNVRAHIRSSVKHGSAPYRRVGADPSLRMDDLSKDRTPRRKPLHDRSPKHWIAQTEGNLVCDLRIVVCNCPEPPMVASRNLSNRAFHIIDETNLRPSIRIPIHFSGDLEDSQTRATRTRNDQSFHTQSTQENCAEWQFR
jgi:hypothetical protein